jgi:hypothetical protein
MLVVCSGFVRIDPHSVVLLNSILPDGGFVGYAPKISRHPHLIPDKKSPAE